MLKPLTPAQERVLREQPITATEPGTILHDFAAFLDFIAAGPVVTTGKNHLLPMASLTALNARMGQPIEVRLKRPIQKSYPHLNGLYLLARATGLLRVGQHAKHAALTLDAQAMATWLALNDTERYFALVEAYLLRTSLEMIGERRMGLADRPVERLPARV